MWLRPLTSIQKLWATGTLLVPIDLLAIIIEAQVITEANVNTVPAPITFYLFRPGVDPDRRATSSTQDLGTQVTFVPVHQVPDVIRIFHPGVYLLIWAGDAVGNVDAHPAKLLFACLLSFNALMHLLHMMKLTMSGLCSRLSRAALPSLHQTGCQNRFYISRQLACRAQNLSCILIFSLRSISYLSLLCPIISFIMSLVKLEACACGLLLGQQSVYIFTNRR